ncbi:hypothetical protein [Bordetella genomosp. 13]|uniref:hypothetical protein n=1 Tax=Bordetella genomosp. 13 TaxID=463040 RepID=UPI00119E7EBA|nr:hypothetical protein [Bordetella genomosp. 13]
MSNFAVGNTGQIGSIDLSSVDLETAMMAVQSQRTQLLESSLRSQLDSVNAKNKQIADLNNQITANQTQANELDQQNVALASQKGADTASLSATQAESASLGTQIAELKDLQSRLSASKCPDPEGFYGLSYGQGDDGALSWKTWDQVQAAGLTIPTGADAPRNVDGNHTMDAKGKTVQTWVNELGSKISGLESQKAAADARATTLQASIENADKSIADNTAKAKDLRTSVDDLKRQVDGVSNSQQMEMLRLQSLTNKNNEAFEVMTNFIKKMQDSRSSIIGNMR